MTKSSSAQSSAQSQNLSAVHLLALVPATIITPCAIAGLPASPCAPTGHTHSSPRDRMRRLLCSEPPVTSQVLWAKPKSLQSPKALPGPDSCHLPSLSIVSPLSTLATWPPCYSLNHSGTLLHSLSPLPGILFSRYIWWLHSLHIFTQVSPFL